MIVIAVIVLVGWTLIGVVWEWLDGRANDADAERRHAALMQELRGHDPDRRLSARRR